MHALRLGTTLGLALAACITPAARTQTVPPGGAADAPALVRVVQSPAATRKEKTDALRQLAIVGDREVVPAITPLLADPDLSHMARHALETLPDPSVDTALRKALQTTDGRVRIGIVHSLGARRDPKAVKPIATLLSSPDPDTAQAAARALGSIGNKDAAGALRRALPKTAPANQLAFGEGTLRCAEQMQAAGQNRIALDLYAALRKQPTLPHQLRTAVIRGTLLADPDKGLALLQGSLTSNEYLVFVSAVRATMEMPGPQVSTVLAGALPAVSEDRQIVVIQALGQRQDTAALAALSDAVRSGRKASRLAALKALPELGQTISASVFVGLLADPDPQVVQAALDGLASTPGAEVDALVLRGLESSDPQRRLMALDLVGRRRITSATPVLLKVAQDPETRVRSGAYRRLGELAETKDTEALLDLALGTKSQADLESAAQALAALAGRVPQPEPIGAAVLSRLPGATTEQKAALLEVLATVGNDSSFKAVRSAADAGQPLLRSAALRALAAWKTDQATAELLALAKASTDTTERLVCLRGYFAWAASPELPAPRRLAMCRDAADVTQHPDEKKLMLGAAGGIRTLESLALVKPHLADAAVREEAAAAVASIATELLKGESRPPAVREALQQASEVAADPDLLRRINTLLRRAGQQ